MEVPTIIHMDGDGTSRSLHARRLSALGKDEAFLERVIADHPRLLELPAQLDGIHEPFVVFRQQQLVNALQATIIPDLLILTASGHIVLVEVKLGDNPELRNRRVIGQIIDYAGAFGHLDEEGLLNSFRDEQTQDASTWPELVERWFPAHEYPSRLARKLADRFRAGSLNLIVACDLAPTGLVRQLAGIVRQSVLPFELALIEIVPYVADDASDPGSILFLSKRLLETEVVSRSVVSVHYPSDASEQVNVSVEATSADDIAEGVQESDQHRYWSIAETVETFEAHNNSVVRRLFAFCRDESAEGRLTASDRKRLLPTFGFYIRGTADESAGLMRQVFNYRDGDPHIRVYYDMIAKVVPDEELTRFHTALSELFPTAVEDDRKHQTIPLSQIDSNIEAFKDLVRSLKSEGTVDRSTS